MRSKRFGGGRHSSLGMHRNLMGALMMSYWCSHPLALLLDRSCLCSQPRTLAKLSCSCVTVRPCVPPSPPLARATSASINPSSGSIKHLATTTTTATTTGMGDGSNDDNGEEEEEDEDEKDEGKEEEKGYTPHNHETHGSSHTRPPYTHAFDRHTLHSRSALLTRTLEEPCAKMRSTLHSFVVLLPRICGEVCSLPAERVEALEVLSLRRQQLLPRRPTLRLHL